MSAARYAPVDLNATAGFYEEYYSQQHGNGLSVFAGRKHMDGAGLASVLGKAFRAVAPAMKRLGKAALRSAGTGALNMARDALAGEDVGSSALANLKNSGRYMLGGLADELTAGGKRRRPGEGGRAGRPPPKAAGRASKRRKKQNGGTIFG